MRIRKIEEGPDPTKMETARILAVWTAKTWLFSY